MRILKQLIRSSHKVVNLGYYVATECLILLKKNYENKTNNNSMDNFPA